MTVAQVADRLAEYLIPESLWGEENGHRASVTTLGYSRR